MRKLLILILSLITMTLFTACNESTQEPQANTTKVSEEPVPVPTTSDSKILIAYFSRAGENYNVGVIEKGNTKIVAEMIAEVTGGDLFEIKTVKPYPTNYQECTEIAKQELAADARPDLADKVADMSKYDTIFLGYPIWWSDMPMAIYTFMESYDFNGKTIIPFCTSAGNNLTGKEVNIPKFAKGAKLREGIGIEGKRCQDDPNGVSDSVKMWLADLGY